MTNLSLVIATVNVSVPEQAPLQPAKVLPNVGAAARVMTAPLERSLLQSALQAMPAGLLCLQHRAIIRVLSLDRTPRYTPPQSINNNMIAPTLNIFKGVTCNTVDALLVDPPALVAVSEQLYATLPINPVTVRGDPVPDAVRVA